MGSDGVDGSGLDSAALRVTERYLAFRISSVDACSVDVGELTPSVGVGLQFRSTVVMTTFDDAKGRRVIGQDPRTVCDCIEMVVKERRTIEHQDRPRVNKM